jgi:hypothetical protein
MANSVRGSPFTVLVERPTMARYRNWSTGSPSVGSSTILLASKTRYPPSVGTVSSRA